jgi:hypothetical protein
MIYHTNHFFTLFFSSDIRTNVLCHNGQKEGERARDFADKLTCANIANSYNSDRSGSFGPSAQNETSYQEIFKVQD